MAKIGDLTLIGTSGRRYEFGVYGIETQFARRAGVYAITRRYQKPDGTAFTHEVIYVGQTGDLPERFDNHHRISCFRGNNANCVCVHTDDSGRSRRSKESDLIDGYDPPCNRQ